MKRNFLDISTGHIALSTAKAMDEGTAPWLYDSTSYGYWIYSGQDRDCCEGETGGETPMPDDLREVLDYAEANDCPFVLLDRDSLIVDGLPVFDW